MLVREDEREEAIPKDQRTIPKLFKGNETITAITLKLPLCTIDAIVVPRTLIVSDEVRCQRFVSRLGRHLNALHEQVADPPNDGPNLVPHPRNNAEDRTTGE